jgi:hypothetical protein
MFARIIAVFILVADHHCSEPVVANLDDCH